MTFREPDPGCYACHGYGSITVVEGEDSWSEYNCECIEEPVEHKHDLDCVRRQRTRPLLCTCGMTDDEVERAL